MANFRQTSAGWLAVAAVWLGGAGASPGQAPEAPVPQPRIGTAVLSDRLPDEPSQAPVASIGVEALGFSAPAAQFLGQGDSFVSLDFLDENRLLFSFRVPGLMHRATGENETERTIRAVVLALPTGRVEAEAVWTLHDRGQYLWMLPEGRFLVRDRQDLKVGDRTLELKPSLHFPGRVESVDVDPSGSLLVTDTREPEDGSAAQGDVAASQEASQSHAGAPGYVVRIVRREGGKVLLVSRASAAIRLAINPEGRLGAQPGDRGRWMVTMSRFAGGVRALGEMESECAPQMEFVSPQMVLAVGCAAGGGTALAALTTTGRTMWSAQTPGQALWPRLARSAGGLRFARETLALDRPFKAGVPVEASQIKGQLVQVLDVQDGRVALETRATPVLDAGGNVALSPSGRRVAVLNGGAIQLFELPAAPSIPSLVPPVVTP